MTNGSSNTASRTVAGRTATLHARSEVWTLVLDICDYASSTEENAKEAVRALRREFKYGEPAAQLAAARLWGIMLCNSSATFTSQSTSRKFLEVLENLLTSSSTAPALRERAMNVLAAAAYASGSKKNTGFRGLWRRVRPPDKPEEGVPFDADGAMFHPPPHINVRDKSFKQGRLLPPRIAPLTDDVRLLFQECRLGVGNANLLSEALTMATPEDIYDSDIVELHKKCIDSQEFISKHISGAPTPEDAELRAANERLLEALKLYDDLKRVTLERKIRSQT
ncbi:hypothetical protein K438DRAFT_176726 [Mycena galopus ATCC 62051]|nr:hypothetical protein K438DRAFT_176726 [Mycena galopus ATCC 62051]